VTGLPAGFALHRSWADGLELRDVADAISWEQTKVRVFGKWTLQPRLTAWMGTAAYSYSGRRHEPAETPSLVELLRERERRPPRDERALAGRLPALGPPPDGRHRGAPQPHVPPREVAARSSHNASRVPTLVSFIA